MSLLRRVLSEKRGLVTVVGAIVLVNVGLYAFAVYPLTDKVSEAERRMTAAASRLAQVRGAYDSVNAAVSNKAEHDNELKIFYTDVLPTSLAAARSLLNPYLDDLAFKANLALRERRTSAPEGDAESLLARLEVDMVLAGGYRDLRQFIYELDTAPEFILIEEVRLSRAGEPDDDLELLLGVSTYYLDGGDAE